MKTRFIYLVVSSSPKEIMWLVQKKSVRLISFTLREVVVKPVQK